MEGNGFRDRIQDFTAKNAVVVGASFDTPAENRAFRDKFDYPYDLLCDESREMGLAYGAAASAESTHPARITILIDPEGKVRKVYPEVTPAEHAAEILADL